MSGVENFENVTDVKSVWERIKNAVKVTPTMVFSVIGDSDSFVPRPWPRTVFQTALIEAARNGGESWILYNGNDQNVSEAVWDAYVTYGNIEFGTKHDEIHTDNRNRHIKLINVTNKKTEDRHAETIVHCTCDNGGISSFLLEFEKFISKQEVAVFSQKVDLRMPVPIAIIVCEGDIDTIAHTASALQNKLPVIIMKGSGKAADLILDYLEQSEQLKKNAGILFGIMFEETNFDTIKGYLKIIRKNRDLIGVFDLNSDDPLKLSSIVGEAVVSCWSVEKILPAQTKGDKTNEHQLPKETVQETTANTKHLAEDSLDSTVTSVNWHSITWKLLSKNAIQPEENTVNKILDGYKIKEPRPGVLKSKFTSPASPPLYFYFGYQLLQESGLLQKLGHILLLEALKANRCDYVRVLLDKKVKLKIKNLPELYEQTVSCKTCQFEKDDCLHMQWILKQILETEAEMLCQQYRCAMDKIGEEGDQREVYRKKIQELETSVTISAKRLCCKILQYEGIEEKITTKSSAETSVYCDTSDILLWAIFANRKEIAEICWLRGKDHLLSGLVCSVLLKKLSRKAMHVKEQRLCTDLEEHSKLFEERCINMLDRMYDEEPEHAVDVMDDEAMIWGVRSSPLIIAYENSMYDIVAHTCSQKHLNKQWYNNLAPDLKPFCKSIFQKPKQVITAPFTKFISNYMIFLTTLIVFSAFVMTSIQTEYSLKGRIFEYFVYIWALGDLVEELISCFGFLGSHSRFHRGTYRRIKRYLYDFWNVMDHMSYLLLISALFVRHFLLSEEYHTTARYLYSLSLLVMYLRFLEAFLIHRILGTKLIMIKEMLKDLLYFLVIALFMVLGVGVFYEANRSRDNSDLWGNDITEWRIWDVLYYPYWQIYSEANLDVLQEKRTLNQGNSGGTSQQLMPYQYQYQYDMVINVVASGYVLFMHILLVNLVIAMFSFSFKRIQKNSDKLWWYERYTAISDYQWRIPSPFNLFFLPFRIYTECKSNKCCSRKNIEDVHEGVNKRYEKERKVKEYRRELQKIIAYRINHKI
uniref:Transient receptor potential cation channel subfamily M member 1-like n=1 Tax=Crassostrea virginica TaxID=6565 RepID=A0A8B8C922_CRAVI|nr:transient receptor potential cation channel subfamily M member 1-like [Crassostrea virginica]